MAGVLRSLKVLQVLPACCSDSTLWYSVIVHLEEH